MLKIIKKIVKILSVSFLFLLIILIGIILSLQIPGVQNFVKDKAITFLSKKLDTEIALEKIYVSFPNDINIQNFYIKGKDVDTLLYVNKLNVGIYLPDLIYSKATISSIDLHGIKTNINRNANGDFNFNFITEAFATPNEPPKDDKPFVIDLDKIELKDINVQFQDQLTQNYVKLNLKAFQTQVKTFDLQQNKYAIEAILIDGFKINLDQKIIDKTLELNESKTESTTNDKPLEIDLGKIHLKNFDVAYADENSKMYAHIIFQDFFTAIKKIDLSNNKYQIDALALNNANIDFAMISNSQAAKNETVVTTQETEKNPLQLILKKMKLNNVAVNYNDNSIKHIPQGIDFNHLKFSKIDFELKDFALNESEIKGKVVQAYLKEKSGLQINEFSTEFSYGQKTTYLKNLLLKTPKSTIKDQLVLTYFSQDELKNQIDKVHIDAQFPTSKIAMSDVFILVPSLKKTEPINQYSNSILNIDTKINGKINDLNIQKLIFSGLGSLHVNANGSIKNAMDPNKLWVNLNMNGVSISSTDIYKLAPKQSIPDNLKLPNDFHLKGNAKGGLSYFLTDLKLQSTFGNANLKAVLNQQKKGAENYTLQADIIDFNVGKLIKNDSIGKLSASMQLSGKSFDLEKADAVVSTKIAAIKFNNYTYKDFELNGKIKQGNYTISAIMSDPNILFDLQASGIYNKNEPCLKLDGEITKIDLYRTGFFDETLVLAGKIHADFSNLNPDDLNGNLSLQDFALAYKEELYPLSEVDLTAVSSETKNQITFESQIFNIDILGKYKLSQLADHLKRNVNSYFNLNLSQENLNKPLDPAYIDAVVLIKSDNILNKFLPDLDRFKDIELNAMFNSQTNKILVQSNVSELIYGDNVLKGIELNIENQTDFLEYNLSIFGLDNPNINLNKTSLSGQIKDNNIDYALKVQDVKDDLRYLVSGKFTSLKDAFEIALNEDGLKLNYNDWKVNPDNYIQISDKGILAHDFEVSQNGSFIHVDSEEDIPNSPLNVDIKNFAIETFTEMIKKDTLLASGIINGKAQINDLKENLTFTTNLKIDKLNVLGSNVGNLLVNIDNESANKLSANVALSGYENDVKLNGGYQIDDKSFDLNVAVNKLQMKSLQGFSQQMISDAKGFISGNLSIKGTTTDPKLLGNLKFNDVGLHVNMLNATFNKIDDPILFTSNGIEFNQFKISDTDDDTLSLNGTIFTKNYQDFKFNLSVFGKGFKVVNSTETAENMLYGVAALDVNLNITGNTKLPKVNGNLKVTNQTDFTFVMPQSSPALQEREGIIEFVDFNQMALEQAIVDDGNISHSDITGLDVSVNIEVDKDAKIAIVLDQVNNDVVKLQGEAQLTGGIDPSGKTTLTGIYEVNKGTYDMSVNVIKRKFDVQQGSTVTWTGEPMKANIDITAIYNLKTAPLDLVQQQINSNSAQDLNLYKQKLPFETLLMIKGELMKPEISFNIELDQDNANVSTEVISTVNAKLEQLRNEESEMNKQVFALLLMNRFIGENPFESNVNVSASSIARQSVSKLLSQQLNNLASDLISGFDINFDLESTDDYTSGEKATRTDLNIGVTKTLFHDRLKVTVGSNFGLEGDGRENEQTNNIAGDVSIEYKLSKNGRYLLRAYRINEYQVALQGEIVETGLGFVINLDYNKFKEIVKKQKNNKNATKVNQNKAINENQ